MQWIIVFSQTEIQLLKCTQKHWASLCSWRRVYILIQMYKENANKRHSKDSRYKHTQSQSYKVSIFSFSLHSSFIAFVYRLHQPLLSFIQSVASLESSHTSMWHSKSPYKRCMWVRHKNVPSNHFLSERRGMREKKRVKERGLKQRSVCVFSTLCLIKYFWEQHFPKDQCVSKRLCLKDVPDPVFWRMSACDVLTFEHKQRGRGVLSDSVLTSNFIIWFFYLILFFFFYEICSIFWDRPLLTASEQDSLIALSAHFRMCFDVKDIHCRVNQD